MQYDRWMRILLPKLLVNVEGVNELSQSYNSVQLLAKFLKSIEKAFVSLGDAQSFYNQSCINKKFSFNEFVDLLSIYLSLPEILVDYNLCLHNTNLIFCRYFAESFSCALVR